MAQYPPQYPPQPPPQPAVMSAFVEEEEYCGPISWGIGIVLCIFFGPVGLAPACCPCDKRKVGPPIVTVPQSMLPPPPHPPATGYPMAPPPPAAYPQK